jgi:hypothetical protein
MRPTVFGQIIPFSREKIDEINVKRERVDGGFSR